MKKQCLEAIDWFIELIIGFIFLVVFATYITFKHIAECRRLWFGWCEELMFWINGIVAFGALLVCFIPERLADLKWRFSTE